MCVFRAPNFEVIRESFIVHLEEELGDDELWSLVCKRISDQLKGNASLRQFGYVLSSSALKQPCRPVKKMSPPSTSWRVVTSSLATALAAMLQQKSTQTTAQPSFSYNSSTF